MCGATYFNKHAIISGAFVKDATMKSSEKASSVKQLQPLASRKVFVSWFYNLVALATTYDSILLTTLQNGGSKMGCNCNILPLLSLHVSLLDLLVGFLAMSLHSQI